jgi:hypothetical protein
MSVAADIASIYDVTESFVEYADNKEYRSIVRKLFKMDMDKVIEDLANTYNLTDIDPETYDELLFDSNVVENIMNTICDKTKNHPLFQNLYDLAAAKMFSIDRYVGTCILFSYNYLFLFHSCLCVFVMQPDLFNETDCQYYNQLVELLKQR